MGLCEKTKYMFDWCTWMWWREWIQTGKNSSGYHPGEVPQPSKAGQYSNLGNTESTTKILLNQQNKGLISRIYKELKQIYKKKKQTSPFKNGQRIWTDTLQKKTYMRPTNIWKNAHHHWSLERCKSKPHWDTISHLLEWRSLKNLETTDAGEDVEK